ncbi:4Fe-4S dicluster domain-containing protein [Desulfonema magnum]|uniref:4Fe-4S dicluster domain-containing protein n=1 Tax=Desulfonema magnum TaxID=45655 RepID=A0A975BWC6_9BACT|nr:4Fe-4S dicluster domain-containing protein [Desulfonema magnum]
MNINLITCAEVETVEGTEGNFNVFINKAPRYIDPSRCTSCGDCAEVCPVTLPSEFDEGFADRKAIYKKYAQAIPGAFAIQKADKAPCRLACPAGLNVQGYVQMVGQGKYEEALKIIMNDLPLPSVLGRICPHECEKACRRCEVDEPVAIRDLKRLAADQFDPRDVKIDCLPSRQEKVAIIGSGPAGLSAAYHLARKGVLSTIFESAPKAGGMLRVGIPEHRLPSKVLDQDIEVITNLGVEIRTSTPIGPGLTVDDLFSQGYKAVYIAIGAHKGLSLGIPNEDTEGVRQGVDFLREVNLSGKADVGKKVVIIGGGNVAIDVARCAVRLGAEEVSIVYRRTRAEMPAWEEEIHAAEVEGLKITYLSAPQEILVRDGNVAGIRCIRMELGEPDASGRRRPVPIPGSEYDIETDQVIPAIGQRPDLSPVENVTDLSFSRWGTTEADSLTYATGREGIFAGGDVQTGPATAIEAIAAGREAAESIVRYIDGQDMAQGREIVPKENPDYRPIPKNEPVHARAQMPELPAEQRKSNFQEVELGYDDEAGRAEAARCLNCGYCCECFQCVEACGSKEAVSMITHMQQPETLELNVGSVILTPGFEAFDPSKFDSYNYATHPNVITSMEMERFLSASGPTLGHLVRPSDHKEPKKIAWFQCVGSRDMNRCDNPYCSSVCCMYAIKEAVIAKEHAGDDLDCAIFFMDMRTHGKDFERYYENAKTQGVRFVRTRVHSIDSVQGSDDLSVRYITESGELQTEIFDQIVLSVGLQIPPEIVEMANRLGVELTEGNFCKTKTFEPVETSRKGIFIAGAFQGPKDIPQSVVDASAAASSAGEILSSARNTLTKTKAPVPETNVINERPRIGVFVCKCGINIAGVVDVPSVAEYAKTLPYVDYVMDNLYTCSQDTQETMTQIIKEKNLNRVVVAACTPKTHEPLFQETLINAGLNKYLFEMCNIRNQDSWVHKNNPDLATKKAKDLVRMAVSKVALMEPLAEAELDVNQTAMVIGGGIAGMSAAKSLALQGYETHIIEQSGQLGGQALSLFHTVEGDDIQEKLVALTDEIEKDEKIHVHLDTKLTSVDGFVGNFKSTLSSNGKDELLEYGVAVLATGASPLKPSEYSYGKDSRIITSLELDKKFIDKDASLKDLESAVFIQCVGSREPERPYCSRVCCTHSIENALELKRLNPDMNIYILYRDIRTYGEREYLYKQAREEGVIFVRYSVDHKPEVVIEDDGRLFVTVTDHILGCPLKIETGLLTLASAIVPNKVDEVSQFFKVPLNDDGFFVEKHAKLGPSDFATDGVFLCGLAHYPKPIDESVVQGKAAASRAVTLLARKNIHTSGTVAQTNPAICSSCGVCVSICPYSAPSFIDAEARFFPGKAEINPVLCKGCGLCVASCRSGAIRLKGFDNDQILAQIFATAEAV